MYFSGICVVAFLVSFSVHTFFLFFCLNLQCYTRVQYVLPAVAASSSYRTHRTKPNSYHQFKSASTKVKIYLLCVLYTAATTTITVRNRLPFLVKGVVKHTSNQVLSHTFFLSMFLLCSTLSPPAWVFSSFFLCALLRCPRSPQRWCSDFESIVRTYDRCAHGRSRRIKHKMHTRRWIKSLIYF